MPACCEKGRILPMLCAASARTPGFLSVNKTSTSVGRIMGNCAGSYSRNSCAAAARLLSSPSFLTRASSSGTRSKGVGLRFFLPKMTPANVGQASSGIITSGTNHRAQSRWLLMRGPLLGRALLPRQSVGHGVDNKKSLFVEARIVNHLLESTPGGSTDAAKRGNDRVAESTFASRLLQFASREWSHAMK